MASYVSGKKHPYILSFSQRVNAYSVGAGDDWMIGAKKTRQLHSKIPYFTIHDSRSEWL